MSWALSLGLLVGVATYLDRPGWSQPLRSRRPAWLLGVLLTLLLGGLAVTGAPLLGGFPRTGVLNASSAPAH